MMQSLVGQQEGERKTAASAHTGRNHMIATFEQSQAHSAVRNQESDFIVASLEGVNKNYGDVRALRGVDFGVRAGEVVALLGPNGAGKTTAVKLLLGIDAAQRRQGASLRRRPHES